MSAPVCVRCRGPRGGQLHWETLQFEGDFAVCGCGARYPVVDGIPVVINSDAHSVQGFEVLKYGVYQARRGGLSAADVMNTLAWGEFHRRLQRRRRADH